MRRLPLLTTVLAVGLAGCSSSPTSTPASIPTQPTPSSTGTLSISTPTPVTSAAALPDWPTYHGTPDRAGNADAAPLKTPLRRAWTAPLDAAVYAQPITAGGHVIAATERNTVYALDPKTGAVRWQRHLAPPARRADLPCGNIDPSGITGTPAYDAATGQIFAVTETTGAQHVLWALDVATGVVRWRHDVDVEGARDRRAEQERGAVLVTGGRVIVAFGGRYGDCGNYVGYVTSTATTGTGDIRRYAIPTAREAGIWAAAGPVVGPGGDIYVASGNGAEVGGRYDGSDSVVRLTPALTRRALFAPSQWRQDNAQDLDLGSMSPVPVGDQLVIAGKRGVVYLLDAGLGGVGGERARIDGCAGYGGAAVSGSTVVMPCNEGVRALSVAGGRLRWLWGPHSGTLSPVLARGAVYALERNGGALVELDLRTGATRGRVTVGEVTRFATPVPVGGYVFVGTTRGVVAVVGAPT